MEHVRNVGLFPADGMADEGFRRITATSTHRAGGKMAAR